MNKRVVNEFLESGDTLRVYKGTTLLFSSKRERLLALLEYIDGGEGDSGGVVVLDKVMGNAAALLSIKAGCREVYSPLGSQGAVATLDEYGISRHLDRVVPYIRRDDGTDICPMEKLSLGKSPEEFYAVLKAARSASPPG